MGIFAFLIFLTSILVEIPKNTSFDGSHSASVLKSSVWKSESVTSFASQFDKRDHFIAQDFNPIVLLADTTNQIHFSSYYLPIYKLHRQKDYFLLI
jgi:hypothetical protein